MIFIKNLFGKNIEPNCDYCIYIYKKGESIKFCKKRHRAQRDNKCRHFKYDPLKRIPTVLPDLPEYDKDDFSL